MSSSTAHVISSLRQLDSVSTVIIKTNEIKIKIICGAPEVPDLPCADSLSKRIVPKPEACRAQSDAKVFRRHGVDI